MTPLLALITAWLVSLILVSAVVLIALAIADDLMDRRYARTGHR